MTDLPGIAIGLGLYYGLKKVADAWVDICLLYTSPSPRD